MSDVFISYSRKDIAFARVLHDALKARSLDTWIDWQDIPPSADWLAEVYQAIDSANTFVFLISNTSINSEICSLEIAHAIKNSKRLVPIVLHDVDPKVLPSVVASLNWVFFREQDEFQASFDKLLKAITADLEWLRMHTRLLLRASEWDNKKRNDSFVLRGNDLRTAEEWLTQAATGKEPKPTPLQAEYILASRRSATRRQGITIGVVTFGLVVAIILALLAWGQRNEAVAQRDRAEQQRRIALSRQLAAQASTHFVDQLDLALLLAVEASRMAKTTEAKASLLDGLEYSPQLTTFLHGHTSYVRGVAFSPDGKTLASGSDDGTIILWDANTFQPIGQPLIGHTYQVSSVAFSPDGQKLASGSFDGTIILWDVLTHQPIGYPLKGHTHVVLTVAFSPDGKTLASGSDDRTVILWDVSTGQPSGQPLGPHWANVKSVAFSPDGQTLVAGAYRTLVFWDIATRQPLGPRLEEHQHYVTSVAFSPDGRILASGGDADNSITLWDAVSRQKIGELPLSDYSRGVLALAFSPDGKTLMSGGPSGATVLWDVNTRKPISRLVSGGTDAVSSVAFSPDGRMLASGIGNSIQLWTTDDKQPLAQLLLSNFDYSGSVALSPDGKTLALGSRDYTIFLFDVASRQFVGKAFKGHTSFVTSLTFSPDGKTLASGSEDNTIILWDVATQQQIGSPLKGHTKAIFSVSFSPNGKKLASGSQDKTIILWDVATHNMFGSPLTGHKNEVWCVTFSPDGRMLASGSYQTIILWDVVTHEPIGRLEGHKHTVNSVAFSPDGRVLASGGGDFTVILWDVATLKPMFPPLRGHGETVHSVAFSPDGKTLASGSGQIAPPVDNLIILWDVATGQAIGQPLRGHTSGVDSVAFSPDGQELVSASFDDTIILWDMNIDSWQARACRIANRNLTLLEWQQYLPDEPYHVTYPNLPAMSAPSFSNR